MPTISKGQAMITGNKGQKAFQRAAKTNALEILVSPCANFFLREKYF